MEKQVKGLQKNEVPECAWLLEHPPLYTLGTSGHAKDILGTAKLPVFRSGRGGQVTYHGPGQRVIYLMLDLKKRKQDIRWYVFELEEWMIQILSSFGIKGERRPGRVGIWVQKNGQDHKIASLGVRLQKWITSHGIALNVNPDLRAYQDIIPCGLSQYGITSLADLGHSVTLQEIDIVSRETFPF
jgi:lipoyl(octanoyl) transferase